MKLVLGLFVFSFILPITADAYQTTDQTATRLTNDTVLYTITYRFGFLNRELYMPIIAGRGVQIENNLPYAGFDVVDTEDTAVTSGVANGIILTKGKDVEIRDNQYYLPAGKVAEFTLLVFATIPPATQTNERELSLLMTHLPFTMIKDETESVRARLNPSELQYYRTPAVAF
jgi:hypothetical protein